MLKKINNEYAAPPHHLHHHHHHQQINKLLDLPTTSVPHDAVGPSCHQRCLFSSLVSSLKLFISKKVHQKRHSCCEFHFYKATKK
jgi:hypothetical protein